MDWEESHSAFSFSSGHTVYIGEWLDDVALQSFIFWIIHSQTDVQVPSGFLGGCEIEHDADFTDNPFT